MAARKFVVAAAFAALPAVQAANATIESIFAPYLSDGTSIASSGDANFSTVVTERWTNWESPTWSGAIKPKTEADVQTIVKISNAHGLGFLATAGGHGGGYGY